MIKKFAAFGLCAAIALSPMAEKPMKPKHKAKKHTTHKKSTKPKEDKTMSPAPAEAPKS